MKNILSLLIIFILTNNIFSQDFISLTSKAAYITPSEIGINISYRNGLNNWTSSEPTVHYYFYLYKPSKFIIKLNAKSDNGSKLQISLNDISSIVNIPASKNFGEVGSLKVNLNNAGFYDIQLKGISKNGREFGNVESVNIYGKNVNEIQYNNTSWRRSASVHLNYPVPKDRNVEWFYGEITVPKGQDKVGSYFESCGFHRGYFGMQVNSAAERRIIFSVWDAGNEQMDRSKVPYENQVTLLAKGDKVIANGFGGEGTGGHSHWIYNWKADSTYKFLLHSVPDGNKTIYTAYFYVPEHNEWKLIASFRAPHDGSYLHNLYSFLENFDHRTGYLYRKGFYGNHWIKTNNGEWIELTKAKFTCDKQGRQKDRIDFGGGIENNMFYLWTGGFKESNAQYGQLFERKPNNIVPNIKLPQF